MPTLKGKHQDLVSNGPVFGLRLTRPEALRPEDPPNAIDVLLDALSVYRITRLVTTDRVTRAWRNKIEDASPDALGYLVTCDWCVGLYSAMFVVCARRMAPRQWTPLAEVLAFGALTGLLAERS